jgi:hypothetical protein
MHNFNKVHKEKFTKYVYYYWIQQFVIVPQVGKNVKKVIIECAAMHRSLKFTYNLHNNNRRGLD